MGEESGLTIAKSDSAAAAKNNDIGDWAEAAGGGIVQALRLVDGVIIGDVETGWGGPADGNGTAPPLGLKSLQVRIVFLGFEML